MPSTYLSLTEARQLSRLRRASAEKTASTYVDEVSMKTIGFIGLGIMGMPMAVNLVRAGYDVVGYRRSGASGLVAAGGREAGSVAEATAGADLVITMLPDSGD